MTRTALGLGSNLGDRVATMQRAVASLSRRPDVSVVAVSALYETDPVGGPVQDDFLNAVVVVETSLSPHAVLDLAHDLENEAHRVRDDRWGPRTLDVDVLAMDDLVVSDETLTLPHPRAHQRAFVLVPWADVDPDAVVAGGLTVAEQLAVVGHEGVRLSCREWVTA